MDKPRSVIMTEEFVKRFFGNAHQTNSYPPALVEDLCISHEALRRKMIETVMDMRRIFMSQSNSISKEIAQDWLTYNDSEWLKFREGLIT